MSLIDANEKRLGVEANLVISEDTLEENLASMEVMRQKNQDLESELKNAQVLLENQTSALHNERESGRELKSQLDSLLEKLGSSEDSSNQSILLLKSELESKQNDLQILVFTFNF